MALSNCMQQPASLIVLLCYLNYYSSPELQGGYVHPLGHFASAQALRHSHACKVQESPEGLQAWDRILPGGALAADSEAGGKASLAGSGSVAFRIRQCGL